MKAKTIQTASVFNQQENPTVHGEEDVITRVSCVCESPVASSNHSLNRSRYRCLAVIPNWKGFIMVTAKTLPAR